MHSIETMISRNINGTSAIFLCIALVNQTLILVSNKRIDYPTVIYENLDYSTFLDSWHPRHVQQAKPFHPQLHSLIVLLPPGNFMNLLFNSVYRDKRYNDSSTTIE